MKLTSVEEVVVGYVPEEVVVGYVPFTVPPLNLSLIRID